jgi:cell fate (sporulation/competence/biofilm development) regulator YlbF (YheA/YmcA/DUF963 family)
MDQVFLKTRELGQALMESEAYLAMKAAEDTAMQNEEAAGTMSKYIEVRGQLQEIMSQKDPDAGKMAALSEEMESLQTKLRSIDDILNLTAAREAFNALIGQVNQVLQFIVTGNMEEESASCGGGCASCGGCRGR